MKKELITICRFILLTIIFFFSNNNVFSKNDSTMQSKFDTVVDSYKIIIENKEGFFYLKYKLLLDEKNDYKTVKIPYYFTEGTGNLCKCLSLYDNKKVITSKLVIKNKRFLLLPLYDFGSRMMLFVFDLKNGNIVDVDKPNGIFLTSYLPIFIINSKDEIIITNSPSFIDSQKSCILVHYYKISDGKILYNRNKQICITEDMLLDKNFLKIKVLKKFY